MATFHCQQKVISRSDGRSATAAAAYRSGSEISDERTGEVYDYTRKSGVTHKEIVLPAGAPAWAADRASLWNAAEQAETRKNSRVAREFEIAIPYELTRDQRRDCIRDFAEQLADKHSVAVDVCIHRDDRKKWDGSEKIFDGEHAHVLYSTRRLGADGFGEKTREFDDKVTGPKMTEEWRERWAITANRHLEMAGRTERIDHRSLEEQRGAALERGDHERAAELDRKPTRHMGPQATALERRGIQTQLGDMNRSIRAAYELGVLERAVKKLDGRIIDTETSLEHVLKERGQVAAERKIDMRAVGKFIADTADVIGKMAGGVLLESIGGSAATPPQPSFKIEQPSGPDYAKDRERLENSTGKPHYYVSGQVEGRLLGKVNLGSEPFARISHQEGKAVALVPWRDEMTRHLGKELTVSHDKGRDMTIQVGGGRDLGRSL